ncbi:endo-1,4-beta-xylanase [Chondrinema litorale]|uniref:endo-1,4-beta-xylanase n=1 Tax=Chondrinema litorale TaxID=2994555 RepID=UPI002543BCF0|nr:endo-1,4-beta-xylanase [Chondrinema litorale]UZR96281.1 endo-1,4-beta-xylanase [Chondrinema litorale]
MNNQLNYIKARTLKQILLLSMLFNLVACNTTKQQSENNTAKEYLGLSHHYKAYFPIGVAVSPRALAGTQAELIRKNFVSMTPENVLKTGPIHPKEDTYNWEPADKIAAFAKANNMKLRGHALLWHNQTPDWLFVDDAGNEVSKEVLLQRLEKHITEVVTRYKNVIYAWDVVNEAISDKPDEFYRNSKWYQICGEEFITKAFEFARAADTDLQLFYNDYEVINPVKREKIYQMVTKLQADGVPIDGVGIQGHWSVFEPSEKVLKETIEQFTGLGLQVQITELDVSIYHKEHSAREKHEDDNDTFTADLKQKQIEQYDMIFRVFRENRDKLSSVTFWNVSDQYSWLDNFPVKNRKDYPLLFDQENKPKDAYWKVVDFD